MRNRGADMDLFETLGARHSYRGEYLDVSVPRDHLDKIALAGVQAPSGCNGQTTRIAVVDDPSQVAAIRSLIDMPAVRTAPAFIVAVSEKKAMYGDTDFEIEDCSAAVENMLLAITALGYASVWLDGALREDGVGQSIDRLLGVPDDPNIGARVLLPVGVPAESGRQNSRKPWAERVRYNRWMG